MRRRSAVLDIDGSKRLEDGVVQSGACGSHT